MLKQIVDVVNEIRKEYPIIGNEFDINGLWDSTIEEHMQEVICLL